MTMISNIGLVYVQYHEGCKLQASEAMGFRKYTQMVQSNLPLTGVEPELQFLMDSE